MPRPAPSGARASATASPRISVIMPTRARADTIGEAIESVLGQCYDRHELVIVVDGPDDPSAPIAAAAARDDRVRTVVNPERLGIPRSRNVAIELARGDLIGMVDSDDALLPGALAEAVGFMDDNRFVGLAYSDLDIIDRDGNLCRDVPQPVWPGRTGYLRGMPFATHLNVFRRSVALAVGGFTETIGRCHTQDFYRKVAERHPIRKIPKTLYRCRIDGRNTSLQDVPPDCERCPSFAACDLAAAVRKARAWQGHVPRKISLFLTTRCNFNCSYCFTRKHKWDLDYDAVARLLVQARDHGADQLTISGGEPTLYRRLDDVVELAHYLGYWIGIISNGWRWPQPRLERFLAIPDLTIGVSLEAADEALHDRIRRKGSFKLLVDLVRRIRAIDPARPVGASVIVTADNLEHLDDVCRWAFEDVGLAHLRFDRPAGVDNAVDRLAETVALTRRYLARMRALAAEWGPDRIKANDVSYGGECPLYRDPSFYELVVYANGRVVPCCFLHNDPELDVGTLHDDVLDITAQSNIDRPKQLVNSILFARYHEVEASRGVFTCVECQEERLALRRSGGLRRALFRARLDRELGSRLKTELGAAIDRVLGEADHASEGEAARLEARLGDATAAVLRGAGLGDAIAQARAATAVEEGPDAPAAPVAAPALPTGPAGGGS